MAWHTKQLISQCAANGATINAVGDYSSAETIFKVQPPSGEHWNISRMLISVEDAGSFDSGSYGNGLALTNGITVRHVDDSGTVVEFTDGTPVTTNAEWARYCYDVHILNFGQGNEFMNVRWTFSKSGMFLYLNGTNGGRLEIVLNDDFTGLVSQYFLVQGFVTNFTG